MKAWPWKNSSIFNHSKQWFQAITIAKGLGIILVVVGHYCPDESPAYWKFLNGIIYKFHMPLFLILSGYLYGKSDSIKDLRINFLIQNKFNRLIIPFISIAFIAFFVKYIAGFFVNLQHPVTEKSFFLILITSKGMYFPLLWFVYSLFIIFIVFRILQSFIPGKYILFLFSISLIFIKWPPYFYLNYVFGSLPFFVFGVLFLKDLNFDNFEKIAAVKFGVTGALVFIFLNLWNYDNKIIKLALGISGSVSIIGLSAIIFKSPILYHGIYLIGIYSMSIYLLHTFISSSVRIVNYQIFKTNLFFIPALIAIIGGIFIPLILEIYVLRKYAITRKLILGLR
jgi:fucose 4-O-acetylase-like acetyltransferase